LVSRVERSQWSALIAALLVADVLAGLGGFQVAARLTNQPGLGDNMSAHYWQVVLLLLPVELALFWSQGLYDRHLLLRGTREYSGVIRGAAIGLLVLVLVTFAVRLPISRQWTVLSWLLVAAFAGGLRFGIRRVARWLGGRKGWFITNAIIIGAAVQSLAIARQLNRPGSGMRVVGVLDDYHPVGRTIGEGLRVLGTPAALRPVAIARQVEDVIVIPNALPWETLQNLMAVATTDASGLRVHLSAGVYDLLTTGVRLSERNRVPLLTLRSLRLTAGEEAAKRGLDLGLAMFLLVAFSPLVVLEATRLRLKGSAVLERRDVVSRDGRSFRLLAFPLDLAVRSELVRKLPGLWNVLAGQLSIVGPRPQPAIVQPHSPALKVRPGLTGLWRQADEHTEQDVLDLYYVRNYSLWLDLQILFARFKARLRGPGSGWRREVAARQQVKQA
jgi:lipopolysaccharide/colanic/teichoic acid biosynthesis glycosyltransferase